MPRTKNWDTKSNREVRVLNTLAGEIQLMADPEALSAHSLEDLLAIGDAARKAERELSALIRGTLSDHARRIKERLSKEDHPHPLAPSPIQENGCEAFTSPQKGEGEIPERKVA